MLLGKLLSRIGQHRDGITNTRLAKATGGDRGKLRRCSRKPRRTARSVARAITGIDGPELENLLPD
jgi:hypothetical protein